MALNRGDGMQGERREDEFKLIYCQIATPCTEDCQPVKPHVALRERKMLAFYVEQNSTWPTEIS
jgi:hypothetical protein